ncbi:MAG: LD-carboxypeptidase [Alphaproteobacteria bacterium]|nr:LD-carboxypeptidase [Alphaproteobacteria bacterium]
MSISVPALTPGDTIGIMAPASYVEREDIERSAALLETRGYQCFVHPQTFARDHQSAGSHAERAAAFHDLWAREDIKAIWSAGGGNRTLHMLEHIDFEMLKNTSPKLVIGFSDVTALLNALYARLGVPSIHGPVFKNVHKHGEIDALFGLLERGQTKLPLDEARIYSEGEAEGVLFGGNLSLFQYLPHTLPGRFWEGAILFLEDCNEELSRIDRMLMHLKRCGVLSSLSGLILGEFSDMKESGRPFGFTLEDIIQEHTKDLKIPVIQSQNFGHGDVFYPLPIGVNSTLSTTEKRLETKRFCAF